MKKNKTMLLSAVVIVLFAVVSISGCKKANNTTTNLCANMICNGSPCSNGVCNCDPRFTFGAHCDSLKLEKYYRGYNAGCGYLTLIHTGLGSGVHLSYSANVITGEQYTNFLTDTTGYSFYHTFSENYSYNGYSYSMSGNFVIIPANNTIEISMNYNNQYAPESGHCDTTFIIP
jgi:hypothetical protein